MDTRMVRTSSLCCLLACLVIAAQGADDGGPAYSVSPCGPPPVIDGKFDDPCWNEAPVASTFYRLDVRGGEAIDTTSFRAARDDKWLYLAVRCKNPDMPRLEARRVVHDGALQGDDSVEIFVDPGTGGDLYVHYLLTFANARGERRVVKGERRIGWDVPWRSATRLRKDGWDAEIGIPLYVLSGHGDLKDARMNVCRNMTIFGLDGIGERTVKQTDWSSWSPVTRSYHEPDHFGVLHGLGALKIQPPFLPSILSAEVSPYHVAPGRTSYTVTCRARGHSIVPGNATLRIEDVPLVGEAHRIDTPVQMAAMATETFDLTVPVSSLAQRDVVTALLDPDTGEVLDRYVVADTSSLSLMESPLADRNFYTTEPAASIRCRFGLPPASLAQHRVRVLGAGQAPLAVLKEAAPVCTLRVPLDALPPGEHTLHVVLEDANGTPVTEKTVTLSKKPPVPWTPVTIDRVNRVAVRDGHPFMPFGIMFHVDAKSPEAYGHHLDWIKDMGFNCVVPWSRSDPDAAAQWIATAEERGLYTIQSLGHFLDRGERTPEGIDKIADGIRAVRGAPNLIAYYSLDEPNLVGQHLGSFEKAIAECELMYKKATELDGYRPMVMLYARDIPPVPAATQWSEILGYDIYLTGGMDSFYGRPAFMSTYVAQLDRKAAAVNQVTWVVPLAERLDPRRTPRPLFPEEQRCQVYAAVLNGARGFLYFVYTGMSHIHTWEALERVAREVRVLAPAVTAPAVAQSITYDPGLCDPATRKFTDVQVRLFRYPNGRYVLLAANIRAHPVDVSCTVAGLPDHGEARRLFAAGDAPIRDGTLSDRLEWYGVRAYELPLRDALDPVEIQINMTPHPDQARAMQRYHPKTICEGKHNRVPNPSFETRQMPHFPDFVVPYRHEGRPAIGEPGAWFALDDENPFHGNVSLRVTRHIDGPGSVCWGFFGITYPGRIQGSAQYVLSMYLRAKKNGDRLWVRVSGMEPGQQSFTLTTEWKRYWLSGTLKTDRFRDRGVLFAPTPDGSTVWVDALQMEPGLEPTDFTME